MIAQPGQDNDWLNQQLNSIHVALSKASAVLRTEQDKEDRENEFIAAAKLFRKTDSDNVEKYNNRKVRLEEYIQKREQETKTQSRKQAEAERKKLEQAQEKEKRRLEEEQRVKEEERKKNKTYRKC